MFVLSCFVNPAPGLKGTVTKAPDAESQGDERGAGEKGKRERGQKSTGLLPRRFATGTYPHFVPAFPLRRGPVRSCRLAGSLQSRGKEDPPLNMFAWLGSRAAVGE